MSNLHITFNYCKQWYFDTSSMLRSMKTRRAITIFHFWYQKMIFSFLFSYGSCFRPRSRTKRSAKTQTKIVCCFWLLQTTHMEEMKAGSTGPPVQLIPLSPTVLFCTKSIFQAYEIFYCTIWNQPHEKLSRNFSLLPSI